MQPLHLGSSIRADLWQRQRDHLRAIAVRGSLQRQEMSQATTGDVQPCLNISVCHCLLPVPTEASLKGSFRFIILLNSVNTLQRERANRISVGVEKEAEPETELYSRALSILED